MTLGQIDAMPHAEYMGWQEFYELEPWGLAVQDAMHAQTSTVLANINRDRKQRPEAYRVRDFLLFPPPSPPPMPEATVEGKTAAQWKLIFAAEAMAAQNKQAK